jgi:hypothetical protein
MGRRSWFRPRRLAWGWGLPRTWQGWLVYAAYALLLAAGLRMFPWPRHLPAFAAWAIGLTALLAAICWATGDKPRW